MLSFTPGWAFSYACAAGTRVESTHTVSGPADCAACVNPSFVPPPDAPDVPDELHAATATATASTPTADAARAHDALGRLRGRPAWLIRAIDTSTTLRSRPDRHGDAGQPRSSKCVGPIHGRRLRTAELSCSAVTIPVNAP